MVAIFLVLFLFVTNCFAVKDVSLVKSYDDAVALFADSPEQMTKKVDELIIHYSGLLEEVLAISDADRTYANTILPIKKMIDQGGDVLVTKLVNSTVELLLVDEKARKVAQEQGMRLKNWYFDVLSNKRLFDMLTRYQQAIIGREDAVEKEDLAELLKKFSFGRENVDPEQASIRKIINSLERQFAEHSTHAKPELKLTAQEMEGVPEAYKSHCKKDWNGHYIVRDAWVAYYAVDPVVREKVYRFFTEHSYDHNYNVISDIYKAKATLAKKQGLPDPAMLDFERCGLPSMDAVNKFLDDTSKTLIAHGFPLLDSMMKNPHINLSYHDGKIAPWDLMHMEQVVQSTLGASSSSASPINHFSYKETIEGMCDVMGALFNCKITLMPSHEKLWHKDVFALHITQNGTDIGYIFFDVFKRSGKPAGASYTVGIVPPNKEGASVFVAVGNQGTKSAFLTAHDLRSIVRKLASVIGQMMIDSPSTHIDGFAYGMLAELFGTLVHDEAFLRAITKNNPHPVPDNVYKRLAIRPVFPELKTLKDVLYIAYLSQALLREQELESAWKDIHEKHATCFLYVPKTCPFMDSLHFAQFGLTTSIRLLYQQIIMASVYREWKKRGIFESPGYLADFCSAVLRDCKTYVEFQERLTEFLNKDINIEDFFTNLGI